MNPEFDEYAHEYSDLLRDPIRDGFVTDPRFFHQRKWMLIRNFFARHKTDLTRLQWLDVGCGRGELLELAGSHFDRAVGCDPSVRMMETCRTNEVYEQPSPVELPFPNSSFDFVTAVCVYHHVHGKARDDLTRAVHRVLRPGGIFCMIEHNPWNPATRLIVKRCPVDADAELLTARSARRLVRSEPFSILETDYFLYLPQKIFRYASAVEGALHKLPFGGQFAVFCCKS